ncbi:Rieske 2Fe-2S domain-containing protein [Sphingobium sp. AS12]|uniref:Rieske 2Fe-2S domain-containing protein n=1 Tax=Sphingobium sp. AS12 TaxID=2849495 RepID=UPI001C31BF0C|nr:Rieske 2Fe-2S domain-containing protein [Sphingobium sp. AS12]MBV2149116.1 Rieske 2Fe-2S domain-containing protein [Sphingobium sp. AS12]
MTEQTQEPAADAHKTATRLHMASLAGEDLVTWRMAEVENRGNPDDRNLQSEFPMGWYNICYADELAVGQLKPVRYFAQDLALWRGEDGKARVTGAYCAHYGANMAVGGVVHGNLLECPFHAWRWDGDGSCKEIPYSHAIPPQAKRPGCIPGWPVVEANGMILVWYHSEGAPPQWEPMIFPEVGQDGWTGFRKYQWHVYTALENMADNAVDISHFKYVHGATTVPEYEFAFDGISRKITSFLKLQTPRGIIDGKIESLTYGPGQGFVRFSGLTDTILVTGTAPVERDKTHSCFAFTQPLAEVEGPRAGLAKALIKDIVRQFDQDKVILDKHRRVEPPLVCLGDGPFGRNRVYYSQFYAKKQPPHVKDVA